MRLIAHAQKGDPISLSSANLYAPLAKFGAIQVNNTGGRILNNHLQKGTGNQYQQQPQQPRITSLNSVQSITSQTSTPTASSHSLVVPLLSSIQAANFGAMFDKTAINGVLPGPQAKNIFLKARLPIPTLEQIWNLVDQNEDGQLTRPQFIIAMHLIQCFMNKSLSALPTILSDQLWKVAQSASGSSSSDKVSPPLPSPSPTPQTLSQSSSSVNIPQQQHQQQQQQQQSKQQYVQNAQTTPLRQQPSGGNVITSSTTNLNTWIMSHQQKHQYGAIFDTLDTSHTGSISSGTVANFLMTSKLPNQVLANIWELANLDQSDNFTKQEFSIAMYLVQKKLAGYDLPEETPIELVQSSSLDEQVNEHPQSTQTTQNSQPPQSFASAKALAAPQRTPSHMDDLLGIFQQATPVPAAEPLRSSPSYTSTAPPQVPNSRLSTNLTGSNFVASSNFGKELQKSNVPEEDESSDDEEGPENLDLPRVRGMPPIVPGRSNKPNFELSDSLDSAAVAQPVSNYEALKSVTGNPTSMFSNQPVSSMSTAFTNTASAAVGVATGTIIGSALGGFSNSMHQSHTDTINDQITDASVDIANYSNQINSLSKQTSVVSGKKDRAQNELNKILKTKNEIVNKLAQLKALHEKENQQVIEVQRLMVESKEESDDLQKELSVVEANYHAEQTKKEQLQNMYEEIQKTNQSLKEKLGTLNAESIDIKSQIEELSAKVRQSTNYLTVTQQQVATQESQNEEFRNRVLELRNSIFQIDSKHQSLLEKLSQLKDENLKLHENHSDLSIQSVNKNVDYSHALAAAATAGVIGEEFDDTDVDKEIPTASLDDFDDENFGADLTLATNEGEISKDKMPEIPTSPETISEGSMSKQTTETTTPTQTVSDNLATSPAQQFSLPFELPHSETSSTQNNPSQSVRGDASPTPTIEQTGPLSSQILPEGSIGETADENSESFEFVNHPDKNGDILESTAESDTVARTDTSTPQSKIIATESTATAPIAHQHSLSSTTSEVETISDAHTEAQAQIQEIDEFPPIQELEPLDDNDSSSEDEASYEDARVENVKLSTTKENNNSADSKNPFNMKQGDTTSKPTDGPVSVSLPISTGPSMFDDLGLEEAKLEDVGDAFDSSSTAVSHDFGNVGFSFAKNTENTPSGTTGSTNGTDGDDWEQVFAGFGNDPNLQPASVEDIGNTSFDSHFQQPTVFGFSAANEGNDNSQNFSGTVVGDLNDDVSHPAFTDSQKLAIEELLDMGFEEHDAIAALKMKNWEIDDASNYLVEKA